MTTKCVLLSEENKVIDYADVCFITDRSAYLIPFNPTTFEKYNKNETLRFNIENKYDKVFDGLINSMSNGKIVLENVRNIGPILHRDVRVAYFSDSSISYETEDGEYKIDIQIKDISSGGMCFYCSLDLDMNIIYESVIEWVSTPIVVKLKLLRKEIDDNGKTSYGCKFLDLYPDEESLLRAGVYYIQTKYFNTKRSRYNES